MTIQTFTAGQKLTALQMNTLQGSDFNFTRNVRNDTSYTFAVSDKGKLVESTNAGAAVFTIANDSSIEFDVGDRIDVLLASTGSVTITPAGGVTLYAEGDLTTLSSAWTRVTLIKRAANSWVMTGGGMTVQTVELDDSSVTSAKIADGTIVNGDINASAGIALSKLATSTAGNIIVYNSSGVPTAVAETGDVTISDTGVTSISSGVIVNADINAAAAIDKTKISGTAITAADSGTVTSTMIANGTIVDADINAAAAIALSKLASGALPTTITVASANIVNLSVATEDIADGAITAAKLDAGVLGGGTVPMDNSVTSAKIVDGAIMNVDINASASIAHSKLVNATPGQVLLGTTTTGAITATTISGDITISGAGVATISANSVALGTDTTGNYMSDLTQGTGVTITHTPGEGSNATIAIGQEVGTSASVTFGQVTTTGNVIVGGDLTVNGTTTTLNTDTLAVEDNIIVLNSNVTAAPSLNAGVEIERGTSANVLVRWNETTDKWETTNDGTTYGNIVTTADSGTITSTMITDGTIVNGDISNTASIAYSKLNIANSIVNADISSGAAIALSKLATSTAGNIIVYNASGIPTAVAETGDISISDTGVTAIASGVIVNADISATAAIEIGKIADVTIDTKTANYTLVLTDKNKFIEMNLAGANTVSVPTNSVAFPIGSQIHITQYGAGKTQVVAVTPGTTTIRSTPGSYLRAQYSSATLVKRATEEWYLVGDLSST